MVTYLAGLVVLGFGLWLVGLTTLILVRPDLAKSFLEAFAQTARAHFLEQGLRLTGGLGFVFFAPRMNYPAVFQVFGWLLIVTAIGLMLLPWRWHRHFATWATPFVLRHLRTFGLAALLLGLFILDGFFRAVFL